MMKMTENNKQSLSEAKNTIEEIKTIKPSNSNEFDVQVTEKIVDGMVQKTKLETQLALEIKRIDKMMHEEALKIDERIKERQQQYDAKVKIVAKIESGITWVVTVGAIAAYNIARINNSKEIQLEKIRQGHFE